MAVSKAAGTITNKALQGAKGFKALGVGAGFSFVANMATGESLPQAAKNAVTRDLLWDAAFAIAPGAALGYMGIQLGAAIGQWGYSAARKFESQNKARRSGDMNFNYTDTEQAYTMRQAAVQGIQESKLNARTSLGKEAQLMHRGIPTRR